MVIPKVDARHCCKNRCTACQYPEFGLDTIPKEDLCEKHLVVLAEAEVRWAREDYLDSLLMSGNDYSKP